MKDTKQSFTEAQIEAARAEALVHGYHECYVAAVLLLEARRERDDARRRWQKQALENARLRQMNRYTEITAAKFAEKMGFNDGLLAARIHADGHVKNIGGTLAALVARCKARISKT